MIRILIIYTGGTIGMVHEPVTGVLRPFDFSQIVENVPELKRLDYEITVHPFESIIDSSDMQPEIWVSLAEIIGTNYNQYDGFVILHGTDTMAFSASALSFMLEGLNKPVVLTGSQLPIGEIRTDAKENLITALEIAAAKENGLAKVPEVCVYFDFQLLRGNRTIKYNSSNFEAFRSPNYPLLAEAGVHIRFFDSNIRTCCECNLKIHTEMNCSINVLKLFPGIQRRAVEAVVNADVDAIIMETFGSGNANTEDWFLACLQSAIENGKTILDISQCKKGSVELGRYDTSRKLKEMGVISGFDMTFEAAITKLMYLLGKGLPPDQIKVMLETNLRGELTRTTEV